MSYNCRREGKGGARSTSWLAAGGCLSGQGHMRGEALGWDGLSRCAGPAEMKASSVRQASLG